MPLQKLAPSFTFTAERLRELQAVVPEAFADGKVNWEALREALGNYLEDDEQGAEHFGLSWPGKREARRLAAKPSKGTLIPAPGEGVSEDATRNLFIEGDNLEVLKLLQKSYAGRVDVIYIDPPYNTGNDFIYKDDFKDPLEDYLRKTGQKSEEGELLTSNPKVGGRFHSNWLSMMYPRLVLARQLLTDEGILFVSIDDNEVHHLINICDEIFGRENFRGVVTRSTGTPTGQGNDILVNEVDYIVVYSKSTEATLTGMAMSEEDKKIYTQNDAQGRYLTRPLRKTGGADRRQDRPNMYFPVKDPNGTDVFPIGPTGYESRWRCGRSRYEQLVDQGLIEWKQTIKGKNSYWTPYQKFYLEGRTKQPSNLWTDVEGNKKASLEIKELFSEKAFDYPKPVELIKKCLVIGSKSDSIVLDFFSGSSTTAHSVVELNRADGGNRQFILVQIPEPTDHPKFSTIAEIGKERIRRVIKKLKAERKGKLKLGKDVDLGFKVFKLARSNYRAWKDYTGDYPEELETLFTQAETPLMDGWTPEGLLTETLLLEGFPLDSAVTEQDEFKHNQVWRVESDACAHRLWVCFEKKIKDKTLEALTLHGDDIFICLDSALSDEAKVQLADAIKLHVI